MRGNAINRLNMSFKLNTEININKLNILKNVFSIEANHIYSEKQLKKIFTTQDDLNGYICIKGMPTQAFLKQGELYQEVFLKDKLGTAFNYITQSLVCFIKFQVPACGARVCVCSRMYVCARLYAWHVCVHQQINYKKKN